MVVTELPPRVLGLTRVAEQVLVQPVTVAAPPETVYSKPASESARAPLGAAKLTASRRAKAADRARLAAIRHSIPRPAIQSGRRIPARSPGGRGSREMLPDRHPCGKMVAEREGFEPSMGLPPNRISNWTQKRDRRDSWGVLRSDAGVWRTLEVSGGIGDPTQSSTHAVALAARTPLRSLGSCAASFGKRPRGAVRGGVRRSHAPNVR